MNTTTNATPTKCATTEDASTKNANGQVQPVKTKSYMAGKRVYVFVPNKRNKGEFTTLAETPDGYVLEFNRKQCVGTFKAEELREKAWND